MRVSTPASRPLGRLSQICSAIMVAWTCHGTAQAQFGPFDQAVAEGKQCISDAVKAGYTSAEAGAKIAQMMASPSGSFCIAQVLAPDPLMIIGAGAVLALNVQGSVKGGSCENDLKNTAFKPLVGALGSVIGMSLSDDPLKGWVDQGVDYAWNTLKTAPPTNFVWSKLDCGCTFVDGGVNLETVKAVANAWTAAGKSCAGFGKAMVKAVCQSNDVAQGACELVSDGAKAMNNAVEGLFQDDAIAPESYYVQNWQPWERSMAYYRYANNNTPPANHFNFSLMTWTQSVQGGMQAASQQNQISFKALRDDTYNYYNNHKHSTSNSNKIANAMADRFWAATGAMATEAMALDAFIAKAKVHQDAKKKEYASKGLAVTVSTGKGSPAALIRTYPEEAWDMWKGSGKGDTNTFNSFLDLAFNTVKPALDQQVKQMDNDKKFASYKDYAIPKRILQADAIWDKLALPGSEAVCESPHKSIASRCDSELYLIRTEAEKLRQSRLSKSFWPSDHGKQDKDGQYVNFTPKYDYAPTIVYNSLQDTGWNSAYGEKWWDNTHYAKVISEANKQLDPFEGRLKALDQQIDKASQLYESIYPLWVAQCGAAIGKPNTPATPKCEAMLAPAIAECALELSAPADKKAASTSTSGAAAALAASGINPSSVVSAGLPAQVTAAALAPGVKEASLACKTQAQSALSVYAGRAKDDPQADGAYPPAKADLDVLKKATPGTLAAALGSGGVNSLLVGAAPRGAAARGADARERDAPASDARDLGARTTGPATSRANSELLQGAPATRSHTAAQGVNTRVGEGLLPMQPAISSPRSGGDPADGIARPIAGGLPPLPSMTSGTGLPGRAAESRTPPAPASIGAGIGGAGPGVPSLPPLPVPAPSSAGMASPMLAVPGAPSGPPPVAPAPSAAAPARAIPQALPNPATPGTATPPTPVTLALAVAALTPDQQLRSAGCSPSSAPARSPVPSTPPADGAYSCPAGAALSLCEGFARSLGALVKRCSVAAR